jgi:hypothetical protein
MRNKLLALLLYHCCWLPLVAQQQPADTFFLAKKKGLLGKLGQTISTNNTTDPEPVVKINPHIKWQGKKIRKVNITVLGFERNIADTTKISRSFGTIALNAFHTNSGDWVIKNNLLFKEGDIINPYMLADNERHLREQAFIQDAIIRVKPVEGDSTMADIEVISKDVFSIGGSANIASASRMGFEYKQENLRGTGSRLIVSTFFDKDRKPTIGLGTELLIRNIRGSFINGNIGYKNFNLAFNSGRNEEQLFFVRLDKPLVTAYMNWVGGLDLTLNRTVNAYVADSVYKSDFNYNYQQADAWYGWNLGRKKVIASNLLERKRQFLTIRAFYQHFSQFPQKLKDSFDFRYANVNGVLASWNLFEQNFYRTNFIYGFGRNEDVPVGYKISVTSGIIAKADSVRQNTRRRPYLAAEAQWSRYNKKGFYSNYSLKLGGHLLNGQIEDLDFLASVDHFTRLRKVSTQWYYRHFFNFSITKQWVPVLNQPLFLRSALGLPYFQNGLIEADMRATAKTEAVMYHLRRFWGFRVAPFVFADVSALKPTNKPYDKTELFTALGAGFRTRNENLIFGTVELKGFYFPRILPGMSHFRFEIGTNIRFKYNSALLKRPDVLVVN